MYYRWWVYLILLINFYLFIHPNFNCSFFQCSMCCQFVNNLNLCLLDIFVLWRISDQYINRNRRPYCSRNIIAYNFVFSFFIWQEIRKYEDHRQFYYFINENMYYRWWVYLDFSLWLSKRLADSDLAVIGLTEIGPIRKISVLDWFLPYWFYEGFYIVYIEPR
jgi:hypothetical protein